MGSRHSLAALLIAWTATVLILPSNSHGQANDAFVNGLTQLVESSRASGVDDGTAMLAAIDAMAAGLAEWDKQIARMEMGLAADIPSAPPAVAARMRTALGAAYLERGRVEDALREFARGADQDTSFAEVHLLRALAFERAGRAMEAVAALQAAWKRNPESPVAGYLMFVASPVRDAAVADAVRGALAAALERRITGELQGVRFFTADLVDDGSVAEPVFAPAALKGEFDLLRAGKYDDAVARLRAAIGQGRADTGAALRNERARIASADALLASGDPFGARAALQETTRDIPDSAESWWKLGRVSQALGDGAEALRSFERLLTLPIMAGKARVYAFVGQLRHTQFDLESAAAAYRRRVQLIPNDSQAHFDLGEVYRAQDRLEDALAEYVVAAMLDPDSARSFVMIGQMQAAAGRDDQAVRMLRRAVDLDASHLEARYALSRALLRLGRTEEARQELAVFEQMQRKAMDEERQRFLQNQEKIDDVLKAGDGKAGR